VNESIPKELQELAAYLGKSHEEVSTNLSIRVLSFFRERHDKLICPELDAYRASLAEQKQKMAEGGKKGGKATQNNNKVVKATLEAMVKPLSRDELSGGELNRDEKKSLGEGITLEEMDEWVADYDNTLEVSNAYHHASKGGH
jgi:general stress protein YciG